MSLTPEGAPLMVRQAHHERESADERKGVGWGRHGAARDMRTAH